MVKIKEQRKRLHLIDSLRGLIILCMIVYHGIWNLVYLYDVKWEWFSGGFAYFLQQFGCWFFILLSGFCWSLGRNPLKRGLYAFVAGVVITAFTLIFMPENKILFGILTFLGSAILIMIPLDKLFRKVNSDISAAVSFILFILLKNCEDGYLGFEKFNIIKLPEFLYSGNISAYFGFPTKEFYSEDYFGLFPWLLLFITGYFIYHSLNKRDLVNKLFEKGKIPVLNFIGRHSLVFYILHQPVLYIIGEIIFYFIK